MTDDVRDAMPGEAAGERPELPIPDPQDAGADATPGTGPAAGASAGSDADVDAAGTAAAPAAPEGGVDYKDKWLRSEAELQNFRRRAQRDREDAIQRAQEGVLLDVIGVLDDLDRALAAVAAERAAEPLAQGVALTAQRMRDALARWDVFEIEAVGRVFDPTVHEAMLEIDAGDGVPPGSVAQVIQKGYRRGERPLRPARVVVARAAQDGR
jgi:molecular chaperone GrpE